MVENVTAWKMQFRPRSYYFRMKSKWQEGAIVEFKNVQARDVPLACHRAAMIQHDRYMASP